ncbi:MAG: S8 family serine peptidase [Acidobacteriota bacterium]|nr:S8 family serine peptidase [Acidobacteriota bacterium]
MRHRSSLAGLLLSLLFAVPALGADGLLTTAQVERLETGRKVGAEVLAELQRVPQTRVMIAFAVDTPGGASLDPLSDVGRRAIAEAGDRVLQRVALEDFQVAHRFRSINAVAGNLSTYGLLALADAPEVLRIDLDAGGEGHQMDEAMPLINIDDVQNQGLTGKGVTVAVLDSGLDLDHADLLDDVVGERCFCSGGGTGCCPDGTSDQQGPGSAEDDHGHGTNVAGVLTSAGTLAPLGGAPDVDIVAIKVLDENNSFCCSSDILAGLDWILNERPDVDLVNLSLGTSALYAGDCDAANAITQAYASVIDSLRARGTTTFASSGNSSATNAMTAPACVASALSVAAVYDADLGSTTFGDCTDATTAADQITCFSNTATTTDLLAPGAAMTSTGIDGGSSTYYGTSQAAPTAAACAALLLEAVPNATPDLIESALEASSTQITDPDTGLTFPRIDCAEAQDAIRVIFKDDFETGELSRWTTVTSQ